MRRAILLSLWLAILPLSDFPQSFFSGEQLDADELRRAKDICAAFKADPNAYEDQSGVVNRKWLTSACARVDKL